MDSACGGLAGAGKALERGVGSCEGAGGETGAEPGRPCPGGSAQEANRGTAGEMISAV